jgi:hypothetical protein
MVGYLSKKPKLSFVDDLGKLYRQRRHATQAKGSKSQSRRTVKISKGSTTSKSKGRSTSTATHGEQPQPERKIELCTPDIVDLPIINFKRRMEKMEIEKEAQHLKAAEARSTCKECEEYDHVQGDGGWKLFT